VQHRDADLFADAVGAAPRVLLDAVLVGTGRQREHERLPFVDAVLAFARQRRQDGRPARGDAERAPSRDGLAGEVARVRL
jgi:hypothetical protein